MDALISATSVLDAALFNSTGYFLVALGIVVSIRFSGFPDLTVDGSFTFGAALFSIAVAGGWPVLLALVAALVGGACSGLLTAAINQRLQIGQIISSVLSMLFLILIVPYLTGGGTVGLLTQTHWLAELQQVDIRFTRQLLPNAPFSLHPATSVALVCLCALMALFVGWLFTTPLGIEARYAGSAVSPGLLTERRRGHLLLLGLAIGNALVGLGGAVEAQRSGGFNQNMGIGVILVGLAILVLGESLLKSRLRRDNLYVREYLAAAVLGVLVYSLGIQLVLRLGLTFIDVRLTTTLFLALMLAYASRYHPNSARLF